MKLLTASELRRIVNTEGASTWSNTKWARYRATLKAIVEERCPTCDGRGTHRHTRGIIGTFECGACAGTGLLIGSVLGREV